jgi:hypothetical protein
VTLSGGSEGDSVCARDEGRRDGSGDSEDFELFSELPRREGGVFKAFVDPKVIVSRYRSLHSELVFGVLRIVCGI